MTTVEKLIKKNNTLREQLTLENKEYYEEMLIYIRSKSLFHDEEDVENLLMEFLNDILEAQSHNESAKSYFGDNPQLNLDSLLKQLPKIKMRKKLSLFGMVFVISSFFSLFSSLTGSIPSINFLSLILNGILTVLFVQGIFYIISVYSFKQNSKKRKFFEYFSAVLYFFIFLALTTLSNYLGKFWLSVPVPSYSGLLIIWVILLLVTTWIIIKKETDYYYFIPAMILLVLLPTLERLPWTKHLFYTNINKLVAAFVVFATVVLFIFLGVKKDKK